MPKPLQFPSHKVVKQAMHYYETELSELDGFQWAEKRFSNIEQANGWFIGVMLDRQQLAYRAWEGGKHLAKNHFQHKKGENFWNVIVNTNMNTIKKICNTGFNGKHYAVGVVSGIFPKNLKAAAQIILEKYDGDVRKIWRRVSAKDVHVLYTRFIEFPGIGKALARMAQFILVREYGVAGGEVSKDRLCVKPDVHVCRVCYRTGLSTSQNPRTVEREIADLKLSSPADFDAALWIIGQDYCHNTNPNCNECVLDEVCKKRLD